MRDSYGKREISIESNTVARSRHMPTPLATLRWHIIQLAKAAFQNKVTLKSRGSALYRNGIINVFDQFGIVQINGTEWINGLNETVVNTMQIMPQPDWFSSSYTFIIGGLTFFMFLRKFLPYMSRITKFRFGSKRPVLLVRNSETQTDTDTDSTAVVPATQSDNVTNSPIHVNTPVAHENDARTSIDILMKNIPPASLAGLRVAYDGNESTFTLFGTSFTLSRIENSTHFLVKTDLTEFQIEPHVGEYCQTQAQALQNAQSDDEFNGFCLQFFITAMLATEDSNEEDSNEGVTYIRKKRQRCKNQGEADNPKRKPKRPKREAPTEVDKPKRPKRKAPASLPENAGSARPRKRRN